MLLKTSKDKKHYHIVYMKEGESGGITSVNKDHSHQVMIMNGNPAVIEADKHSHTIEKLELKQKDDVNKDKDIVNEVRALFREAKNNEKDFRKKGIESLAFRFNEQWEASVKQQLKDEDRSALTLNHIASNLRLLSGYQRQNRTDIRYFPAENGDSRIADILNIVVKNILDQTKYSHEETNVFNDVITVGRGNFHVYMDFNRNIEGEIKIERFPWRDIYYGSHEKFDLSDCEYVIKAKWFSKAKIKQLWASKVDKIQKDFDSYDSNKDVHIRKEGEQFGNNLNDDIKEVDVPADPDFVDIARKEFRVLECQRKEYKTVYVLVKADDGFYFNADGMDDKDVEAVQTIKGFQAVPTHQTKIRELTIAGGTVLSNKLSSLPLDTFNIVPAYADKSDEYIQGKVEDGKDAQREINKRHSQIADILNKVANYGYYYDNQTFENPTDENNFKKQSAKPGFVTKVKNSERPPKASEGVKFPSEIANFAMIEKDQLREIMSINPELLGLNSKAESGIAIIEKKRQGLVGNEYLFDNLSFAKNQLGIILVKLIQKYFTPERMTRIVNSANQRMPVEINKQPLDSYTPDEIKQLLETADLTQYDVYVGESAYSISARSSNFAIWSEIAMKRPEFPLEVLIDMSDLPDKDKVLGILKQMREQQMQVEQGKQQTEIDKAMIARETKMQGAMQ